MIDNNNKNNENKNNDDINYYFPVKDESVYLKCPHCEEFILTKISKRPGVRSLIFCCLISLVTWCGCCLIPCCLDGCLDFIHKCPECDEIIAIWERKL